MREENNIHPAFGLNAKANEKESPLFNKSQTNFKSHS